MKFLPLSPCGRGWREAPGEELDGDARRLWIQPAIEAIKLLNELPRLAGTELLFPGTKGQAISIMTMTDVMHRMKTNAVPHGFRSTFRDWAGEKTNFPRELAEQALAHTLQNKVEAAYRRGDALEKRRQMMQEWANFILE